MCSGFILSQSEEDKFIRLFRAVPMRLVLILTCLFPVFLVSRCRESAPPGRAIPSVATTAIQRTGQSYRLLRHGKPYFIRGAGFIQRGTDETHFARLRECGGNSIRVWDDIDARQILDEAQRLGLTVMLGLWVEREAEGFDYHDQPAVDRQYARIRKTVLAYRNHPALLMWCVGNEWSQFADNFSVFDEVNRIAAMVHQLDPNHPTSTAISPDSGRSIWLVRERCPEIDILAFNTYADIPLLRQYLQEGGWTGPYLISEFGARGYWQTEVTPWNTPIEPTSDQKGIFVRDTYQQHIGSQPPNCLGAYLFIWGTKQEETHTWFSFFDEVGREYPIVGLMQQLWTGHLPANQAPVVDRLLVDGNDKTSASFPASASVHQVQVLATDPEGDPLAYKWEIKPAARNTSDYINTPVESVDGLIASADSATTQFRLPRKPGAYRLFVYIYDTHRHVATANLAFEISATTEEPLD